MAIFAAPSGSLRQLGGGLLGEASRSRDRSLHLLQLAEEYKRDRRRDFEHAVNVWRQFEEAKKGGDGGDAALWGAGAGVALAAILAPFTFGASLSAVPAIGAGTFGVAPTVVAGAAAGGGVGATIAGGAALAGSLGSAGAAIGSYFDSKDPRALTQGLSAAGEAFPAANPFYRSTPAKDVAKGTQEAAGARSAAGADGPDAGTNAQSSAAKPATEPETAKGRAEAPTLTDQAKLDELARVEPNPWFQGRLREELLA